MVYKKKKSFQNIIFSQTALTIIGLLILIFISIPLFRNIQKQLNVNEEVSSLKQEITDLEKKNTELKGLISYLNSDQFTEEQARLNLNYKKEGEELVIIKDDDLSSANNKQDMSQNLNSIYNIQGLGAKKSEKKDNNFKKWIKYFWH